MKIFYRKNTQQKLMPRNTPAAHTNDLLNVKFFLDQNHALQIHFPDVSFVSPKEHASPQKGSVASILISCAPFSRTAINNNHTEKRTGAGSFETNQARHPNGFNLIEDDWRWFRFEDVKLI